MNDLDQRIATINRQRSAGRWQSAAAADVEALFQPSTKLFVYGTLRPGAPNHHVLDGLTGNWHEAVVRGSLSSDGWGATQGYPAITLDANGTRVAGAILESPELAQSWERIDDFEGDEYVRLLTRAETNDGVEHVVNVYTLRPAEVGVRD